MDTAHESPARQSRSSLAPTLIYVALFFAVWTLRATVLYRFDTRIGSDLWRSVYSNVVKFAVWVVPAFVYLLKVDRRDPLRYLKLTTRPEGSKLPFAFAAAVLYLAATCLFGVYGQGRQVSLSVSGVALASTSISSLSEEILFRGFILNKLREGVGFRAANLATALLFVAIHLPNWLWTRGFQRAVAFDCLGVFLLACLLGYLVKETNSLWAGVGLHVANNVLSSVLRP
ncbi:MAG: CPBP family intramembrane glutamic endopeptidase [Pyrinomonadaceae bacterium]